MDGNKIKSRDKCFGIDLSKGTGTFADVFLSLSRIECLPQKMVGDDSFMPRLAGTIVF